MATGYIWFNVVIFLICKSLWIKAFAKWINGNAMHYTHAEYLLIFLGLVCVIFSTFCAAAQQELLRFPGQTQSFQPLDSVSMQIRSELRQECQGMSLICTNPNLTAFHLQCDANLQLGVAHSVKYFCFQKNTRSLAASIFTFCPS